MRIAGVQAASVYLDRKGTIGKVFSSMEAAARGGVQLVAFLETFVPGYSCRRDVLRLRVDRTRRESAEFI